MTAKRTEQSAGSILADWVKETHAYYDRLTFSDERWDCLRRTWIPESKEQPDQLPDEPET